MAARDYPYAFQVALDGSRLSGLVALCIFSFDPADKH
jgi:hypothetical protein